MSAVHGGPRQRPLTMASSSRHSIFPRRLAVAIAVLLRGAAVAGGSIPMKYCASENTASTSANTSTFQSDGLCHDFCNANYALAIVQGSSCWCSNEVPAESSQVSVDRCDNACPGYPSDVCGGNGLFGYMLLDAAPSGTADSDSSTTSAPASSATPNITSSSSVNTTSSTSLPVGMTTLPATVQTVTAGGVVQTVTVTPTVEIGSTNGRSSGGGGLSTGPAVGIAVGIVVSVAILAGIALFFCLRRRHARDKEDGFDIPSAGGSSSGGKANTPKTEMSESQFNVRVNGPTGPEPGDVNGLARRQSKLMPVDPRMNPFGTGIYGRDENLSYDSIHTIRDDQDYSRRVHEPPKILRAMNPDPQHDD